VFRFEVSRPVITVEPEFFARFKNTLFLCDAYFLYALYIKAAVQGRNYTHYLLLAFAHSFIHSLASSVKW
jgi:hypothetical protein